MKMKKESGAATAKKAAPTKKPAAKSAAPTKKPTAKSAAPKKAAKREPSVSGAGAEATARPAPYTPAPVQGIGWAPFRYPPQ